MATWTKDNKSSVPSYTNDTKASATFTNDSKTSFGVFDQANFDEATFDNTGWSNEVKS